MTNGNGNPEVSVNGGRTTGQGVQFNGIDATNFSGTGSLTESLPPAPETVQEVDAGGPLGWYMRERRREALVALNMLTDVDPKDVVEIARQQAMVREYLNVRTWVREKYATGEHAKTILREEFADENRGRDGYGESTN